VQVTNRTARFLRPADGVERLFRSAAIGLAKQHAFARALVNTGRMAVANPYGASPLSDAAMQSSISVQNVALQWAAKPSPSTNQAKALATKPTGKDTHATPLNACLNDLLRWAGTRPLLLVFGDATGGLQSNAIAKLRALASASNVRVVHVVSQPSQTQVCETVVDAPGLLASACGLPAKPATLNPTPNTLCHWALLRPDSYLAARGSQLGSALVAAVARCAGTSIQGERA
jgi:3-(3-hydroxy-phenyl)propionate hydroxylase